jgi:hypothetical protein
MKNSAFTPDIRAEVERVHSELQAHQDRIQALEVAIQGAHSELQASLQRYDHPPRPSPLSRAKEVAMTAAAAATAGAVRGVPGLWAALERFPNVLRWRSIPREAVVAEEGAPGGRYTDVQIFKREGKFQEQRSPLVAAKKNNLNVAIRADRQGYTKDRTDQPPVTIIGQTETVRVWVVVTDETDDGSETDDYASPISTSIASISTTRPTTKGARPALRRSTSTRSRPKLNSRFYRLYMFCHRTDASCKIFW